MWAHSKSVESSWKVPFLLVPYWRWGYFVRRRSFALNLAKLLAKVRSCNGDSLWCVYERFTRSGQHRHVAVRIFILSATGFITDRREGFTGKKATQMMCRERPYTVVV